LIPAAGSSVYGLLFSPASLQAKLNARMESLFLLRRLFITNVPVYSGALSPGNSSETQVSSHALSELLPVVTWLLAHMVSRPID
jgi:hypothetical protein